MFEIWPLTSDTHKMYPDFANILYTVSYTIAEESLKILELGQIIMFRDTLN